MNRVEGRVKVTGLATYAAEYPIESVAYAYPVQSLVAKGRVVRVHDAEAREMPGVLAVLSCADPPRLAEDADPELALFQSGDVAYRGQIVAAVVADTYENARAAAAAVRVEYDPDDHDVTLRTGHPGFYRPDVVNPNYPADTVKGDVEAGLAGAAASVDVTYSTPVLHNNPMEPHAAMAVWDPEGRLLVYDSTQGASPDRDTIAQTLGLPREDVRVVSRHVGGGFGSKGSTRPHAVLAALAARAAGRPVKIALTRHQMFDVTGYRTPTIQRLRLGADAGGRLTAVEHLAYEQTSTLVEFAEQTATPARVMYATPALRTAHRLVRLDVATPSWMRAPGECPGMYALESAMDELACALGMDPVELRVVNDADAEPESGLPFSSRNLVLCLREGARRFGWRDRDPEPGVRREGEWLVGTGVAASTYPARRRPATAFAFVRDDDYVVQVAAADIGTGARTALTRIAAETLGVAPGRVHLELGDSDLPDAPVAGGSMGTSSWGSAVVRACEELKEDGKEGRADTTDEVKGDAKLARHAFGAQFAEVRVSSVTGEIRVPRLLGVFAAGRIVDGKLARSQFIGGMTMGLGMALMEETLTDEEFGGFLRRDLAQYHVPACADVPHVEAVWLDEQDGELNPMGSKGIGEIGIVGTAAAIGNAVHHATGHRVRELPITPGSILSRF
ncbi:xanthine dehydrogenase family protein molybdopterin-binding subunit [Nonomuraea sp. KC401]|uniref:xanthine dehydrogenase family protein molybdopterin-binding subunit n=1 Tax=unclassified Nonomuraea TaxID=2593643 RepID=UPI0010FDCE25|nr:xanthine dehydrogenase family protein molybdopterin-binding subunit [Nonomuraea sp. KC401]NBE96226.1 molybdopterin-dependent oxidoreductase [Nonomuraea sp. K271]TLF66015.1 xanthine dehydrogenase family protein molybdopterin-binding subunit [Nonomuraea sp. KC401]